MKQAVAHKFSIIIFSVLAFGLISFILIGNFAPFGITKVYSSGVNKEISDLGPKDRVSVDQNSREKVWKVSSDLVYFTTNMPFRFDSAKIKIYFQNPSDNQDLYLGFQDQTSWHYDNKLIDTTILKDISWPKVGTDTVLYQKSPIYSSIDEFFTKPPSGVVGVYNLDKSSLVNNNIKGYTPSSTGTVINTSLRGKNVMYLYLQNEPFKLSLEKQDLNWYEGQDNLEVKIFKENILVYSTRIEDDGVVDASRKVLPPQTATLQNPGPGLPENGVYKVVFEGSGDMLIKKITTNLQKIVFEGPLYIAENSEVYKAVEKTNPTTLFTDGMVVTAQTYHGSALQDIRVGSQVLKVDKLNEVLTASASGDLVPVEVPKGDVILNSILGYFSFDKNSFFRPTLHKTLPLTKKSDIDVVDFILTDYNKPSREGEWQVAEQTFDLTNAVIRNGKLSWLIRAPNLKANGNQVMIRKIEVEFSKKPLFGGLGR